MNSGSPDSLKIWFVNRFFHPDHSATSQVLTDLVTGLDSVFEGGLGCGPGNEPGNDPSSGPGKGPRNELRQCVVTSRLMHDDPRARLAPRDRLGTCEVFRLWSTRFGRHRAGRALDYLSFHLAALVFLLRRVRRGDAVVLKTDPPLLQLFTTAVVRLRGGRVVNWLQDLHPEIAERLGLARGFTWAMHLLARWRDRALRAAELNVVIGAPMAAYLGRRGVLNTRVIPNGADEEAISGMASTPSRLRQRLGWDGRFVVMYSGNLGRVHAFAEIRAAMRELAAEPGIGFLIVGSGAERTALETFVKEHRLPNVQFLPLQPRELLADSLAAGDLHLVSLKPGMEELVTPSKLYGILAAGRPVAFIGDADSAIARLVEREKVGFAVRHGDWSSLCKQIQTLAADTSGQMQYRQNARRVYEREFSRTARLGAWAEVLQQAAGAAFTRAAADSFARSE